MPGVREIERQQRDTWDRFSAGWIKWDPQVVEMQAAVGQEMIRLLALADDGVHLDVASGTGEPGLSISAQMPKGRVVLTDLSEAMLAGASSKAEKRALGNVEVRVCGVDDLPFEDATFDSVSCRFGFMFFPDIRGAVTELVRIVRPGGRISTAVWAEPDGNAWATTPMGAISAEVALAPPEPDAPGLFRCAAPDSIAAIFREAGLHALAGVDDATSDRIRAATIEKAQAFEKEGKLSLPYHARCVVGTR